MKGFLFLGLVGAAIYALLVYTHHVLPGGEAEDTFAGQTQPNQQDPAPEFVGYSP